MKIIHVNNYEELSFIAAKLMLDEVILNPTSNLCLATGTSPSLAYDIFVKQLLIHKIDTSTLRLTKLDEWCGLAMDHPATCEFFIRSKIINKLKFDTERYLSFDSMSTRIEEEVKRVHEALMLNPIDLCILGLGKNGHLGLNEPANRLLPFAHQAKLAVKTKSHPMIEGVVVDEGMTLGMQEIMNSKKILLIVSGEGKQKIYRKFLQKEISTRLPASFLWLHPDVTIIVQDDHFPPK